MTTAHPRLLPAIVIAVAGLALAACQSGGNGAKEGEGGDAAAPAQASSGKRTRPIPTVMESGEAAFHGHDYEKARSEFMEVVDRDPGNAQGRYWLGRSLLELGRPAEAREQLEVALATDVENDDIYKALCRALYDDKKLDELFRLLRQRATEHGTVADYTRLAEYCQKSGDMDEAHTALLTAARLDQGRHIAPQLALADFYAAIGNQAEESRRLRMAYYIDRTNEDVQHRLVAFGHHLGPGLELKPLERP